jgi:uncharacterized protein YndB with AHSA1/START domain
VSAPGDRARVTVRVAVEPQVAFTVFTEEIDRWWRHGPRYRLGKGAVGKLAIEPGLGGRITETYGKGGRKVHDVGKVTVWEPPARLAFEWRSITFEPDEVTTVEVSFTASGEGTEVTLEHRGWSAIRGDHPVRHGAVGAEFMRSIGLWWGGLLTSYRELCA